MDDHTDERRCSLDTTTAEVKGFGLEVLSAAEEGDEDGGENLREWEREELEFARQVVGDPERFVRIPHSHSSDPYGVMEDFVATLSGGRLKDRLFDALGGRGPFRRFKDVLLGYPTEREQWFQFEANVKRRWAREWLQSIGIKPADDSAG